MKEIGKTIQVSWPGMAVTGVTGGIIGSFIGRLPWIAGMALVGAVIGAIVWRLGGQRFFLLIVIGAALGGGGAFILAGAESALLGIATGGAMGGFLGVNLKMMTARRPR